MRNTSTCVEKTRFQELTVNIRRKHLHVCGENLLRRLSCAELYETPPRVWRKLRHSAQRDAHAGNTSTCVEKTFFRFWRARRLEKHLHVCGENAFLILFFVLSIETPPRVWRKRDVPVEERCAVRNTSTCVEKTKEHTSNLYGQRKHLHVCGENG